jgi:hypothetical protein
MGFGNNLIAVSQSVRVDSVVRRFATMPAQPGEAWHRVDATTVQVTMADRILQATPTAPGLWLWRMWIGQYAAEALLSGQEPDRTGTLYDAPAPAPGQPGYEAGKSTIGLLRQVLHIS